MTTLTIESIKKDLADGLKYKEIAEKNGVSLSSVKYVVRLTGHSRHAQATPETIEAMKADRASGMGVKELSIKYGYAFNTISRHTADVKKSPETVSTPIEPASEDITDSGSSADTNIIPEVPENVKQDDYSPYESAVDDAVLDRIEKIRDRITEMQFDISNYETELNVLEEFHLKYMEAQNNERSNENC